MQKIGDAICTSDFSLAVRSAIVPIITRAYKDCIIWIPMFLTASSYQIKSKNYFLFCKTYVATGTIIAIAITSQVVKLITLLLSKASP